MAKRRKNKLETPPTLETAKRPGTAAADSSKPAKGFETARLKGGKVDESSSTPEPIEPLFARLVAAGSEIQMVSHAEAILRHDMPNAASEIEEILLQLEIPVLELIKGGGGEAQATQRTRKALSEAKWDKHEFNVKRIIDGIEKASVSHIVDHVKKFDGNTVALEIEWNNKDPFFDRDLENFKRLHADGAISVGCVVTRGRSLHEGIEALVERFATRHDFSGTKDVSDYYTPTPRQKNKIEAAVKRLKSFPKGWANAFCSDKFGEATTHWAKLQDRVSRGVGNPCPLLLIGIPLGVVKEL